MICKKHKTYRGIRKPTANCRKCKFIFAWRKVLKACGFPVAQVRRAPKSEATKVGEFCKEFGLAIVDRGGDKNHFLPKTENFAAGLEADPEFPGVAFGAGPSAALPKTENFSAGLEGTATKGHIPGIRFDAEDALALQVAAVSLGAEKRVESWRTPEVAAQLQAHARGELTEHQRTALFLKLNDAGAFSPKEQVRNIGEGAKAE